METTLFSDPHQISLHRFQAVVPRWTHLATARDALGLTGQTILHAGPAFGAAPPTIPIRNSAACAAIFEGWANSFEEANRLLDSGEITLAPSQDHNCVVPLAAVVSPSMMMQCVSEGNLDRFTCAPLNGGHGPAPRLGQASDRAVEHLRWLNGTLAPVLSDFLETGFVNLLEIADHALSVGDDCHGATAGASTKLREYIFGETAHVPPDVARFLEGSPSFFLNLWMAATKLMMTATEGVVGSTFITAAGGNGRHFGIKIASLPDRWFTCYGTVPAGLIEKPFYDTRPLPAIGDSAIIDVTGLGAMVCDGSPPQRGTLQNYMPCAPATLRKRLRLVPHPGFTRSKAALGLSAKDIAEVGLSPAIALGVLDGDGIAGRIGGGVYVPLTTPFLSAVQAMDETREKIA